MCEVFAKGIGMSGISAVRSVRGVFFRGSHAGRTLMVAGLAHALHDGYTDSIYVLLPVWQSEFALGYGALALLRGLYAGAMAALQLPAGRLAQRVGGRKVTGAGNGACGGRLSAGRVFRRPAGALRRAGVVRDRVEHPASDRLGGGFARVWGSSPDPPGCVQLRR